MELQSGLQPSRVLGYDMAVVLGQSSSKCYCGVNIMVHEAYERPNDNLHSLWNSLSFMKAAYSNRSAIA